MDEQLFPKQQPDQRTPADITTVATKLRLAEERYKNLQNRNRLTEDALLSFERDMRAEMKAVKARLLDVKRRLVEVNAKVDGMENELQSVVKKHEFTVVERYVDLWQPMRWVTVDQARRMMEDR